MNPAHVGMFTFFKFDQNGIKIVSSNIVLQINAFKPDFNKQLVNLNITSLVY